MNIPATSIKNNQKAFNPNIIQRTFSRIGGFIPKDIHDICDLSSKGAMKRVTFMALASIFLLGARYFQSRNADERREVATRDFSAVVTAIYAVPILKKFAGMLINKKTQIPIAYGEKGFWKNLNPEKGVQLASTEQLSKWFSVKSATAFDGIKKGFTGFCVNIKKLGGNLMKCFNILDEGSEKILTELAGQLGINKKITNKNILKVIYKAEKSTDTGIQDNLSKLKEMFVQNEKGTNSLLQKASHLKSATEFTCIAATAFLLGGFLPWFNIHHTRSLYKNNKPENDKQPKPSPANNSPIMNKFDLFKKTGQLV